MKRFPFVVGFLALLANLILGGGTHPGFLADAVLQFLCIFVCAYAIWRLRGQQLSRAHWVALTFIMLAILLPALALIPLPPSIIENLPQWEVKAAVFQLIGRPAPWSPVSVSPEATWLSLMSLIPALAVFLTSLQFDLNERRQASLIILGFGIVSVFLGLVQLAQGPASPLRLFPFTNIADAVGFFANRNHLSALLYVTLLVAAAWAVQAVDAVHALPAGRKLASFQILWLIAALTAIVLVLAAQAMTRSRAGLGLTIIALLGAYLLAAYRRTTQARLSPARLLMGAVGLAVVVSTQFALYGLMERLADDPLKDARIPFARNTFESAKSFMPLGAGLGSFIPVYGMFEKPTDAMMDTFANRAHNDVLELWLETGVFGLVLMTVFGFWFIGRSLASWRGAISQEFPVDGTLARAATIIIGLLVAHSLVDYPLRTNAILAVFVFCCALLLPPLTKARSVASIAQPQGVPSASRRPIAGERVRRETAPTPTQIPRAKTRWGQDVDWPKEWQSQGSPPKDEPPP